MTQFENPYSDPAGGKPKTSGLAVTSLVCGLICCIPLLTPLLAILFGLLAVLTIQGNPLKKGMGLAVAGIVLGLAVTAGQVGIGLKGYAGFKMFRDAPMAAMQAGFSGDLDGFRAQFGAAGEAANNVQAGSFINQLRVRYGEFQRSDLDFMAFQGMKPVQPNQTVFTIPWLLVFDNGEVLAEFTFDQDEQTPNSDTLIFSEVRVIDAAKGELVFPPDGASPVGVIEAGKEAAEALSDMLEGEAAELLGGEGDKE